MVVFGVGKRFEWPSECIFCASATLGFDTSTFMCDRTASDLPWLGLAK